MPANSDFSPVPITRRSAAIVNCSGSEHTERPLAPLDSQSVRSGYAHADVVADLVAAAPRLSEANRARVAAAFKSGREAAA